VVGKPPMEDCFFGKATERIFLPLIRMQIPEIVDIHLPLEGVFHNCALVSIRKNFPGVARKVMHSIWGLGQMMFTKVIIVLEDPVDLGNYSEVAWKVLNHFDPSRDLEIVKGPVDALNHASSQAFFGGKVGIDATRKTKEEGMEREWPPEIIMDPQIKKRIDEIWKDLGI